MKIETHPMKTNKFTVTDYPSPDLICISDLNFINHLIVRIFSTFSSIQKLTNQMIALSKFEENSRICGKSQFKMFYETIAKSQKYISF